MEQDGLWCHAAAAQPEVADMGAVVLHCDHEPLRHHESVPSMGQDLRVRVFGRLVAFGLLHLG